MKFNVDKSDRYKTGVYRITNLINNKFYIGSTANNFYNRFHQHISDYKAGKRDIRILYAAIDKYGIHNFEFKIVEFCNKEDVLIREQFYLDLGTDYNCAKIAGNLLGLKHLPTSKTRTMVGSLHHCAKICYQFDLEGNFIKKHESIIEALKEIGKTKNGSSHITQCAIGKTFSVYGFRWSFTDNLFDRIKRQTGTSKISLSKDSFYQEFHSQKDAAIFLNEIGFTKVNQSRISNSIKRKGKINGYTLTKLENG